MAMSHENQMEADQFGQAWKTVMAVLTDQGQTPVQIAQE